MNSFNQSVDLTNAKPRLSEAICTCHADLQDLAWQVLYQFKIQNSLRQGFANKIQNSLLQSLRKQNSK